MLLHCRGRAYPPPTGRCFASAYILIIVYHTSLRRERVIGVVQALIPAFGRGIAEACGEIFSLAQADGRTARHAVERVGRNGHIGVQFPCDIACQPAQQAGGKVLDVNQAGSAQTTAFALDEVELLQFPEQLDRLVFGAAEGFLYFSDGVDDIHPPLLVQPTILYGQAHAVQQNAVQCPGIGGELPETVVLEQCLWDAEVGKQFARLTIKTKLPLYPLKSELQSSENLNVWISQFHRQV